MSSTGPSNKSHKSRYVALGAVSALSLLALGGQTISANSVVVKPGDTVWGIANQYATTTSALENANPTSIKKLNNSIDLIQAGQSLVLPNTSNAKTAQTSSQTNTYTVKRGDTLSAIAKKFGVTVNQLMAWNHLTNADRIQVGQVLVVSGDPNASVQATTTTASATAAAAPAATTSTSTTTTQTSTVSVQPASSVNNQATVPENSQTTAVQGSVADQGQTAQPLATNNATENANTRAVYAAYTNTSYQPVSQATQSQTNAVAAQSSTANTVNTSAAQQATSQATTQTTSQQAPVANNTVNTNVNSNVANGNGQVVVVDQPTQAASAQASQTSQTVSQVATSTATVQSSASQQVVSSAASTQSSAASQAAPQTSQATQNNQNNQNPNTQGGVIFVDNNQTSPTQSANNTGSVVSLAVKLANSNIPYVWGGNSLSGMDCSGLVDYVYLHATGKQLPHYTVSLESCVNQKPVSQAQAGDLLFWGSHGATYHTAIYIGNNQYVAAPEPGENVQVQTISQYFMPSFAGTVK